MNRQYTATLAAASLAAVLAVGPAMAADPPVDAEGRPLINKLGTVAIDRVEHSPVVFQGQLYLFHGRGDFHFVNLNTGEKSPQMAPGYAFGNAFVDGDTMIVSCSKVGPAVYLFTSRNLKDWSSRKAFDLPEGFKVYNTSICRDDQGYMMMFEIGEPPEFAGARFTAMFARSKDLKHWNVLPPECNYAKDRYTAPHALRYLDGWYYDFYLELNRPDYDPYGFEMCVVRSKDLIGWEPSPLNPVLRPSEDDRKIANPELSEAARQRIATAKNINNSDIDFCEYQGHVEIFYSWGNQRGVEHLARAVYAGTLEQFLRGWYTEEKN